MVDVGSGAYPVTKKVLVVEDNELNLKLFCDLLRAHGYEAEPVRDGWDAVDRARETRPDLIVMDIQLPHVTGLELIETINRELGELVRGYVADAIEREIESWRKRNAS